MATTDTLKGLLSGLLNGSQIPAPPTDPYVLNSQLTTKLNSKLDKTGDASGAFAFGRSLKARATDVVNVRDYGAFGDGVSHTVLATLGVSKLVDLANFLAGDGSRPYAFVNQYPFGVLFNLSPGADAPAGSTSLIFQATGILGVEIQTSAAAASGATTLSVYDLAVTSDATPIAIGTPISGTGIAAGTTVTAISGSLGAYTLTISAGTTAAIPAQSYLKYSTRPASGSYSLPMVFAKGVHQGDVVTGPGISTGTQVDLVNASRMEVIISQPLNAQPAAGATYTYTSPLLSNITVGMQVSGPGIAAGTTVTAINLTTGVVTLSTVTTAAITARSALTGTVAGAGARMSITFYRPYTDAETATLEMDGLGIQAAINVAAAQNGGIGGSVVSPNGDYRSSFPLILPLIVNYDDNRKGISLGGLSRSDGGFVLRPTKDFGPGSALISCGDPSATVSNGRGLYDPRGMFCPGALHDISLAPPVTPTFVYGQRPKWNGVPVAMDGIKQGPRLNWDRVRVSGFRAGALAVMDHTRIADSYLRSNFYGLVMDDLQPNIFGDNVLDRNFIDGNAWAGFVIARTAYFNGEIRKPYLSNQPYAFYFERGIGAGLQNVTITHPNIENLGLGFIKDGGIRDGYAATGATRSVIDVTIQRPFIGGYAAFGSANVPLPVGKGAWAAYIDLAEARGFQIEGVGPDSFTNYLPSAPALVMRVGRLDAFNSFGRGGFSISGDGVADLITRAAAANQSLVIGAFGLNGDFMYTGSWQYVLLEGPTFKARPMPMAGSVNTPIPLGTALEYSAIPYVGTAAVQPAGQRSGAPIAGISCQDWPTQPPHYLGVLPIVCVDGSRLPVVTSAAQGAGTILKADTANPGKATTAIGVTDGPALGLVVGSGSASLAYIQPLWTGR
jgi:hypothetical protein